MSTNLSTTTIVVGGGIGGLYCGYRLLQAGKPFFILEKSNRVGGRIHTTRTSESRVVELGAGVVASNQTLIMNLIQELNVDITKLYTSSGAKDLPLPTSKTKYWPVRRVLTRVQKRMTKDYDEVADMLYQDYYQREKRTKTIYKFNDGFESLIHRLHQILSPNIITHCHVNKIDTIQQKVYAKRWNQSVVFSYQDVVLALDLEPAKKLKIVTPNPSKWSYLLYEVAQTLPTQMIIADFFTYPKSLSLHQEMVSQKSFRWYFRTGPTTAVLSYTDGKRTQRLRRYGEAEMIRRIYQDLDIDAQQIKQQWISYWPHAFQVIVNPRPFSVKIDRHVYQSFIPHRYYQAWVEGTLRQIDRIVKCLLL